MSEKIHFQGKIPFKWENKPGVSKAAWPDHHHPPPKLPPLPYPPVKDTRVSSIHDMQIPPPPCPFPSRSSSRKDMKKVISDDPFLIAYKEVTKGTERDKVSTRGGRGDRGSRLVRNINKGLFSCKSHESSCCVEENSFVRLSAGLSISRSYGHK